MSNLAAEKWVRVMADHSADPVWHRDGCMAGLDELPVSPELIQRLEEWAAWHEENRSWDGDYSFDFETFASAGRELAQAVKAELPGWTVIYWDEAAYMRDPNASRQAFEYEIA